MSSELTYLVQKAQKGDSGAFSELISLTENKLFRFCLYICGSTPVAEDLYQETYLRAFEKIKKLKNPSKFVSWLYRISRNLFLDFAKSAWSKQVSPDSDGVEKAASTSNSESMLEILRIQQSLRNLSPEDRMLLLLVDHQGFSYREASEIIGISEAALTSRLHRARRAFLEDFDRQ